MSVRSTLRLARSLAALAPVTLATLAPLAMMTAGCTQPVDDGAPSDAVTAQSAAEIVGGRATSAHPAVGAFVDPSGPFCTGTLVSKRVIVTAAHCFDDAASRVAFVLGPDANRSQTVLRIASVTQHPQWDAARLVNDIAMAVLAEDAPVPPIAINTEPLDDAWVGRSLSFVGYGTTNGVTGAGTGVKRAVSMPVSAVGPTQFAYGDRTRNTCFGDSGGPALLEAAGGQVTLVGVTSFGDATCTRFGVDTRVDAFRAFLATKLPL